MIFKKIVCLKTSTCSVCHCLIIIWYIPGHPNIHGFKKKNFFIDPPKQRKSTTNFQKLKKSLQFQCIKRNGSGKYSTPSIYRAVEDEADPYPTKDSPALDHKPLKSVLSNSSRLSKSPDQHRHHHLNLSSPSHHSIYFQLGSDQSDENSDDNDDDGDLGSELLGFCHDEEGHDDENNHINTNLS